MNARHHVAIAMLAVALCACSTMKVTTDFDPKASFTNLKTFDWEYGKQKKAGDPRIDNELLDKRIRRAVEAGLAARGFVKDTAGTPNFLIGYHVALRQELSAMQVNDYYGYHSPWSTSQVHVSTYNKGTLILDIVEATSGDLIWRGTASDTLEEDESPETKRKRLDEAVRKMLERFPPQKKAPSK